MSGVALGNKLGIEMEFRTRTFPAELVSDMKISNLNHINSLN
jgi:hypothetical protein